MLAKLNFKFKHDGQLNLRFQAEHRGGHHKYEQHKQADRNANTDGLRVAVHL